MEKYKEVINKILYTGWIWGFGWVSFYLYQISKWKDFKWLMFFANITCAFFVGYTIGCFLPETNYTDWLLAISWFSAYPIMDILEKKWAWLIFNNISKWKQ